MKKPSLAFLAVMSTGALLAASPAAAFTDAQHRAMMRDSPAYAQADKELNAAWRELRTALKNAGIQEQFDGGTKPPHPYSLLASQREWLARRDSEAESMRFGGSTVDGHIAAMRARTVFLRERTQALRAFASLPASAPGTPFARLMKVNGREMSFKECPGDSGSPQQRCASAGEGVRGFIVFEGTGMATRFAPTGRANLPARWRVLPDGRVRVMGWEGAEDYTLRDGRYLETGDGFWLVLDEGSSTGELGQPD